MRHPTFPLLLALACGAATAAEPDAAGTPPQTVEAFAREFQSALRQQDTARVAEMVAFPLRVNTEGRKGRRVNQATLLKSFDQVFTPGVVKGVLAQDPTRLFQNSQGVMFGDGAVWAAEVCPTQPKPSCPLRVITVNRPARSP